jgi:hypothetical protein
MMNRLQASLAARGAHREADPARSGPALARGANSLRVLPGFRGTLVHDSLSLYAGYPDADH